MKIAVNFKVSLSQIDQARCFNGKKGKYVDLTAFIDIDEVGQFGDNGTITQQTSKEERDQGIKLPIIGNTTVFWRDDGQPVAKKDLAIQQQGMQQAQQAYQQPAPQQQGYQNQQNPTYQQQAPAPQQQYAVNAQQQAPQQFQQEPAPFDDDIPF